MIEKIKTDRTPDFSDVIKKDWKGSNEIKDIKVVKKASLLGKPLRLVSLKAYDDSFDPGDPQVGGWHGVSKLYWGDSEIENAWQTELRLMLNIFDLIIKKQIDPTKLPWNDDEKLKKLLRQEMDNELQEDSAKIKTILQKLNSDEKKLLEKYLPMGLTMKNDK